MKQNILFDKRQKKLTEQIVGFKQKANWRFQTNLQ